MSINAKDLIDSYKTFKATAITKEDYGDVWLHKTGGNAPKNRDECWDLSHESANLGQLEITEFMGKEPKDCIIVFEEPIDYRKWVGKLCWFWDDVELRTTSHVGILTDVLKYCRLVFKKYGEDNFQNCRPVRRDEVQFVED